MVQKKNNIRYLGVTLDPKFNWSKHADNVTANENSTLGIIQRKVLTNSESIKNMTYKQLVCSVLEYACAAWNSASDTVVS